MRLKSVWFYYLIGTMHAKIKEEKSNDKRFRNRCDLSVGHRHDSADRVPFSYGTAVQAVSAREQNQIF
jgi:hypothetical protein